MQLKNAVAYDYSNGFLEGTNRRLKNDKNEQCMDVAENSY